MRWRIPYAVAVAGAALSLLGGPLPATADHTDPNEPLVPVVDMGDESTKYGGGTWTHIANFGGTTGTDVKFFHKGGSIYVAGGQLGQAEPAIVGQRILRLTDADGTVNPQWVADHGSAHCGDVSNIRSTTGLQHDSAVTPRAPYGMDFFGPGAKPEAQLLVDTVDALGRCHDKDGGGLELIDISGIGTAGFEPREIHLTRHSGFTHTVTVDATRPWIVYNSTSDFGVDPSSDENPFGIGAAWIDVLDIRTCLNLGTAALDQKRTECRPKVYRIPFSYEWTSAETPDGDRRQPSACHDITARPGKIYCAGLNGTVAIDVAGLTDAQGPTIPAPNDAAGDIKGTPLPCTVKDAVPAVGGRTAAKVTDCVFETPLSGPTDQTPASVRQVDAYQKLGRPQATGWRYVGHVNHPGRECGANGQYACNNNRETPADEGVALSHESDPSPDGKYLFVTDERGGGVIPEGATCVSGIDNPNGNGGLHVFDMTKKDEDGRFSYATTPDGDRAVYISKNILVSPTFCTIHVIEQIPDEQRIIAAWYSQGVKILDYFIDENGNWTFEEVAGYTLHPNDIWAAEPFKLVDNPDGTRTYYFASNDILRGMDVFSWTGPTNKIGAAPPRPNPGTNPTNAPRPNPVPTGPTTPATGMDYGLLGLAAVLFPAAIVIRRRLARA